MSTSAPNPAESSATPSTPQPGRHEALAVVLIAFGVMVALALLSYDSRGGENWVGPVGAGMADTMARLFGLAACWLPVEFLAAGLFLLKVSRVSNPKTRAASTMVFFLLACTLLHLSAIDSRARVFGGHLVGGIIGELSGEVLRSLVGLAGAYVIWVTVFLVALIVRYGNFLVDLFAGAWDALLNWVAALAFAWHEAREIESGRRALPGAEAGAEATDKAASEDSAEANVESGETEAESVESGEVADSAEEGDTTEDASGEEAAAEEESAEEEATEEAPVADEEPLAAASKDADGAETGKGAGAKKKKSEPVIVAPRPEATQQQLALGDLAPKASGPFILPSATLLSDRGSASIAVDEEVLRANAALLVEKLEAYGVKGRVDEIHPGPVVTLYEFEPRSGTKVSKISGLADDLAMALAAQKVRIVAPIPGKARVGFELPNHDRQTVYLRGLLEDARWAKHDCALPIALGKDIAGQPVYGDLSKMPHVLVAGATGAGKSVGLNVMLTSLLLKKTPEEVRFLMIDPKVVELAVFDGIPHMLLPVVTDMNKASLALRWAVDEMERRYQMFADVGARNISTYNARVDKVLKGEMDVAHFAPKRVGRMRAKGPNGEEVLLPPDGDETPDALESFVPERLPSIVLVVDEFADLMMVAAKDVEAAIARLAQKARAAGLHVILATQRPSVDVITGMIKANFPSRIAYKVSQREDSKTILGRNGAEHLLGLGDMLTLMPGSNDLRRVHSAFITEDEVKDVCDFLRAQAAPVYDENILKPREDEDGAGGFGGTSDDPQYDRAVSVVAEAGYCSISHIQRQLSVGYNKAAKIVERMEAEGVVGPPSGKAGGRREVLIQSH